MRQMRKAYYRSRNAFYRRRRTVLARHGAIGVRKYAWRCTLGAYTICASFVMCKYLGLCVSDFPWAAHAIAKVACSSMYAMISTNFHIGHYMAVFVVILFGVSPNLTESD